MAAVLESLNLPLRPALNLAAKLGIQGVQVDAVGELAPAALSQTGRRDLSRLLRSLGLELCALGCPLRHDLHVADQLEARLNHVRQVMSLAYDLGPRLVVAWAGSIPKEEDWPSADLLRDSLTQLGRHGERIGTTLALAAGSEPPELLAGFLQRLNCGLGGLGGLGVHVDPASLLLRRHDPVAAVGTFQQLLVHTHARDALADRPDRVAEEAPLGHGDIDWVAWLGALEEIGYRGWLTIRRGPCPDPAGDIRAAAAFLRRLGA
jgi:sugar phosphate isomerase/epimerase